MLAALLAVGSGGGSALRAAVDANDRDVVKAALAAGAAADEVGADGQTAVLYATLAKKYKAVNALLAAGADPNIGDAAGRTALHHAALNGDAPLAKWLLIKGLRKSPKDRAGLTPLHHACLGGESTHTDAMWTLLDAGVPADERSADGRTPLDMATAPNPFWLVALHRPPWCFWGRFCYRLVQTSVPCARLSQESVSVA